MPITFSITCDSDAELARFIENLRFGEELAKVLKQAKSKSTAKPEKKSPAKKAPAKAKATAKKVSKAPAKAKVSKKTTLKPKPKAKAKPVKAATATKKTAAPKTKKVGTAKKATPKKTSVAKKPVTKATKAKASKKPAAAIARKVNKGPSIIPIITESIQEVAKKGKPFRTRDVVEVVMKKQPSLNESSVVTGVSKQLADSKYKWEQIKDAVGRPYKLYKP